MKFPQNNSASQEDNGIEQVILTENEKMQEDVQGEKDPELPDNGQSNDNPQQQQEQQYITRQNNGRLHHATPTPTADGPSIHCGSSRNNNTDRSHQFGKANPHRNARTHPERGATDREQNKKKHPAGGGKKNTTKTDSEPPTVPTTKQPNRCGCVNCPGSTSTRS